MKPHTSQPAQCSHATVSTIGAYDEATERQLLDQRLTHIPLPAGATTGNGWSSIRANDGDAMRILEWSRHDSAGVQITVSGWQDESGKVAQFVTIYDDGSELSAQNARDVASALNRAADALEYALESALNCVGETK